MTPWEEEILVALTCHLRVLSLEQIARIWWTGQRTGFRRARESMHAREKHGWVKVHRVFVRPIAPLTAPLNTWQPGQTSPDFNLLSEVLRRRSRQAARATHVVTATRKSRELFGYGGAPRRLNLTQLTHELSVAEIYFCYREAAFDAQQHWLCEDRFPKPWPAETRPDGLLLNEAGDINRAVEYGGYYGVKRLTKLHHAMAGMTLAYEIW